MKTFAIPSWGDDEPNDPQMVEVSKDEIISVLAWRLHDLQIQVKELRAAERVS